MTDCDYLGPKGFIKYRQGIRCPLVVVLPNPDFPDLSNFNRFFRR